MNELALRVRGLGKRYRVGQVATGFSRARDRIRRIKADAAMWAVADVDFDIAVGEAVAIVGRNGAGKSTLLKLLSRITEPTTGFADIYGRVGSLLEVGTGFHPELTGRENVYMNGAILGMRRAEIAAKFDDIVEFAGVERHIDTPVKWYSSGMYVRLAFSVAAHLEPEILVVDEVLAVGDAEFQNRCLGRMGDVAHEGRTVLFVSHNMQAVRRLCERGLMFESGRLVADGEVEEVVRRYLAAVGSPERGRRRWEDSETRPGDDLCRVVEVNVADESGRPAESFFSSRPIDVTLEFDLEAVDRAFVAGFDVATVDGVVVFRSYTTDATAEQQPRLAPGRNVLRCRIPGGLLNSGRYVLHLRISLFRIRWLVYLDEVMAFDVIADHGDSLFLNEEGRPGVVAPLLRWDVV